MKHHQALHLILSAVITLSLLLSGMAFGQAGYDEGTQSLKQGFADNELAALSAQYTGISADGNLVSGLFPIRATGVSAEP